jgi:hypothetical protein
MWPLLLCTTLAIASLFLHISEQCKAIGGIIPQNNKNGKAIGGIDMPANSSPVAQLFHSSLFFFYLY